MAFSDADLEARDRLAGASNRSRAVGCPPGASLGVSRARAGRGARRVWREGSGEASPITRAEVPEGQGRASMPRPSPRRRFARNREGGERELPQRDVCAPGMGRPGGRSRGARSPLLRTLLVQSAQYILGPSRPRGPPSPLGRLPHRLRARRRQLRRSGRLQISTRTPQTRAASRTSAANDAIADRPWDLIA